MKRKIAWCVLVTIGSSLIGLVLFMLTSLFIHHRGVFVMLVGPLIALGLFVWSLDVVTEKKS